MNLKSRLSRLQTQTGAGQAAPVPQPPASQLRRRLETLRPERLQAQPVADQATLSDALLAATLGGEPVADGVIRVHRHIPLTGRLGTINLNELGPDPRLPGETGNGSLRHVYIDTETTGLSGGSGTLAFLVGIAVFGDAAITLTQFLLTGFGGEKAMLSAFAGCLTADDRLVSYNGKSFDLPLLLTRFRMQALSQTLERLPHLDLLHPVRRLFGRRWNNCRLQTVERNLLGFNRVDDLPGSEAPAAWFDFLRRGQAGQLPRVVDHHRQDIISLAVAHRTLAKAVRQPDTFSVDLPALARWQAEHDESTAHKLLETHKDRLCPDGRRLLGHYCRRAGDWPHAVAIWESLAATGCTDSLERLVKYHEHISRDLAAARKCCRGLTTSADLEHRLRRIDQKIRSSDRTE